MGCSACEAGAKKFSKKMFPLSTKYKKCPEGKIYDKVTKKCKVAQK